MIPNRTADKIARPLATLALALAVALPLAGCDKPLAMGEANSIIVVAPDSIWESLEPQVREVLEPTTFTVRDERIFEVTQIEPGSEEWERLYVMRQILVIGPPDAEWVAPVLERARGDAPEPPAVVSASNVWAQNQAAVALLLPEGQTTAPQSVLAELGSLYLEDYQRHVRSRMFVTGADEELADSLQREAGFSLLLPNVYRHRTPEERTIIFRNDNPDPSELIRSVTVSWRPLDEVSFSADALIEWRSRLAAEHEQPPQVTEAQGQVSRLSAGETDVLQAQGVWSNPPDTWPAAGPFLTRLVRCEEQDRMYLLDGWVYAPGKPKYEYMFQIETILNSFACGNAAAVGS